LDSYIDEGTRCRLLESHDDFERLLNTRHPRAGCYGNLIRSEHEQLEQQPAPELENQALYDDELSNEPIGAGGIAYVEPANAQQPWEQGALGVGDEGDQQEDEENIVAWSQQLSESHLVRNEQGHGMGGRLQLPIQGRGYMVPADDWAETRGQRFFRAMLVPAEWWVNVDGGEGYARYPSRQAVVQAGVYVLGDDRGVHELTFVWSPDFRQDRGRNIYLRFSDNLVEVLNEEGPDGEDYRVIADRQVGDYVTLARRGDHFFLVVSRDNPPTPDELRVLTEP